MSRLIDADNLKRLFRDISNHIKEVRGDGKCFFIVEGALKIIDKAPTVDAVEVVRCKDCKNWHSDIGWCDEHSSFIDGEGIKCHPWESSQWRIFNEDDYCSYAERKEEND